MTYYLAIPNNNCKNCDTTPDCSKLIFTYIPVPKEVSIYVKQLEAYIRYPTKSKLLDRFPWLKK